MESNNLLTHRRRRPGGGRPQKTASVTLKDIQGMYIVSADRILYFHSLRFKSGVFALEILKTITNKTFEEKSKVELEKKDQRIWLICQISFDDIKYFFTL